MTSEREGIIDTGSNVLFDVARLERTL